MKIDSQELVANGFANSVSRYSQVHVDISELARRKTAILLMATVGVLISTFAVGGLIYYLTRMLGLELPFIWALVFGALISPTDPVAVLGILKNGDSTHNSMCYRPGTFLEMSDRCAPEVGHFTKCPKS